MLKENKFDWWIVECFQHLKALASNWSKASSFGRSRMYTIHGLRVFARNLLYSTMERPTSFMIQYRDWLPQTI